MPTEAELSINSYDDRQSVPNVEEVIDYSLSEKSLNKFKANDNLQSNLEIF